MSSWFSSWLPGLPVLNLAIPSSLQGRFVSFLLKKCLGHFLKPGQLDIRQIESQIGSGFVQVNDLELSDEAINSFLTGLPLSLHDGYISSVKARVPWPNPLTSSLGLSLDALHLTFHVVPVPVATREPDLVESVASIADSFVHEELTEQENTTLRESVHLDTVSDSEGVIPGGLNPFLLHDEEANLPSEHYPAGVSLFSTLAEKLLARFEFNAVNTKVTIIHEGNVRHDSDDPNLNPRVLTVSGLMITTRNLRASAEVFSRETPSPSTPRSPSRVSQLASPSTSSSSLDEETQALMSQSIVALPPHLSSSAASISNSLYQSALSGSARHPDLTSSSEPLSQRSDIATSLVGSSQLILSQGARKENMSEDVLISFGSVPLTIRFQAPPVPESNNDEATPDPYLAVSVTVGPIASTLRAWQIAGILQMTELFAIQSNAKPPTRTTKRSKESAMASSSPPTWLLDINLEALVVLALPPTYEFPKTQLAAFFADPLKPPSLPCGYLRFYAWNIALAANSGEGFPDALHRGNKADNDKAMPTKRNLIYEVSCNDVDVSVYSFPSTAAEMLVLPVLSVDQSLAGQYAVPSYQPEGGAMGAPLPTFRSNDWLDTKVWDVDISKQAAPLQDNVPDAPEIKEQQPPEQSVRDGKAPAILIQVETVGVPRPGASALSKQVSVTVLPIHIFLDVRELVGNANVTTFLDELTQHPDKPSSEEMDDGPVSDDEELGDTPPATAKAYSFAEREKERKRLERLVMEDLGLSTNLTAANPETARIGIPRTKHRAKSSAQARIVLMFSMVRIHVRCLPPPGRSPRSGELFVDIHQLGLTFGEYPDDRRSRFTSSPTPSSHKALNLEPRLVLKFSSVVLALSPVGGNIATAIGFLTSFGDDNDLESMGDTNPIREPLKPRISLLKTAYSFSAVQTTVLDLNIPSIHLNLTKDALDGLIFLADDVNQLLELTSSQQVADPTCSPSLKSDEETQNGTNNPVPPGRANAFKVCALITEVTARFMATRSDGDGPTERPLDILTSDLVVSFETTPDNAEQSIMSVEMMEFSVKNMNSSGILETLLSRTAPRNMSLLPTPALQFSVASLALPNSKAKATKLTSTLWGLTGNLSLGTQWLQDLSAFVKSPPGVFETVVPSECTRVMLRLQESSLNIFSSTHPGRLVFHLAESEFTTDIVGNALENNFRLAVPSASLLCTDDTTCCEDIGATEQRSGVSYLRTCGYALIADITDSVLSYSSSPNKNSDSKVEVERANIRLHLCADTLIAISSMVSDWRRHFDTRVTEEIPTKPTGPAVISELYSPPASLTSSVDEFAFRRAAEIGPAPDMINDDLPTNLDYLDESFSATAGLREFSDEDLDDFRNDSDFEADLTSPTLERRSDGITSRVRGETVKMMQPEGIQVIEGYFESLPDDTSVESPKLGDTSAYVRIYDCNFTLCLYDGFDWAKTRKTIEEEVRDMRRRLGRLRQLVASGQTPDSSVDEMSAVLFNSVHIGLVQDAEDLEPGALIAAIDEQLNDDMETASQGSWQSLRHTSGRRKPKSIRVHGKRLTRSRGPSMEFVFSGVKADLDYYHPSGSLLSRNFFTVRDVEIFDHIKTSTWRKFLTALQLDSRGNTRETGSNMIQAELQNIRPVSGHPSEEVRIRAKILPLRLYVDQDAVDFLKKFFSFKDPNAASDVETSANQDTFIQFVEVFPVLLKLDYKPRRVDYKALREGRTIELMNFFHFDGAEMTLRHITLTGITGWARMFELLNDLWTPDVKATQLVDVISGVAPIRSVVNVGSGVADLVLLPIAQYKKDGRILRGLQKGTTAFFKSTALEAVKLGAKLATGTQVILEQAEGVLGGQFQQPLTAETVTDDAGLTLGDISDDEGTSDVISKYAEQPADLKEGMHSAYRSLRKNFGLAAQTILAVPMEMYERSGDEGAIRSVIRAVPIAVLKPTIGATEAVSKTLLGLHNTLDSNVRHDNEAKYKHR